MAKLSVCINSHNAELYIRECLESVSWADEIVVQDCSSTDHTVDIAREYTDKIFVVPNNPDLPNENYNRLFERASRDWILFLNEDERVSPELRDEIRELMASDGAYCGYRIPRRNLVLGRWIENGMLGPEAAPQLRLFRTGRGRFACRHVHEDLIVDGPVGKLKEHMLHDAVRETRDFLRRIAWYSTSQGEIYLEQTNGRLDWRDFILVPARYFALDFFVNHGYREGVQGLAISLLLAMDRLAAIMRAWDQAGEWARVEPPHSRQARFRNEALRTIVEAFIVQLRTCFGTTVIGRWARSVRNRLRRR